MAQVECMECGWYGDESQLIPERDNAVGFCAWHCPECYSEEIEEYEDAERDNNERTVQATA